MQHPSSRACGILIEEACLLCEVSYLPGIAKEPGAGLSDSSQTNRRIPYLHGRKYGCGDVEDNDDDKEEVDDDHLHDDS